MNFRQFLENLSDDYNDEAYVLYMPYQHPPNMDIVTPVTTDDGKLYGWKSIITGQSLYAYPNEDKLLKLPKSGWVDASQAFKKQ